MRIAQGLQERRGENAARAAITHCHDGGILDADETFDQQRGLRAWAEVCAEHMASAVLIELTHIQQVAKLTLFLPGLEFPWGNEGKLILDGDSLGKLRDAAEAIAAIWGALAATTDPDRRRELIERHGAALVMNSNRYGTLMRKLGLEGPLA